MELLNVCIYLRKSRADREAEARGEGETLARHERILLDLAKKRGYNVGAIYKEIVSGETISARPVMQQLLREVESGMWDGVLVVEVERLARGDTIDQGVVARSFQYSNTLINPVYEGMIRWNSRKAVKHIKDGQITISRPFAQDYILVKGRHPAIVSRELFQQAQDIVNKNPARPLNSLHVLRNPLAGIVRCGKCDHVMTRKSPNGRQGDLIRCPYSSCSNISSKLPLVEKALLDGIQELVDGYRLNNSVSDQEYSLSISEREKMIQGKLKEIDILKKRKQRQYDLLEQGIYSTEEFLERSRATAAELSACDAVILSLKQEIEHEQELQFQRSSFIPKCEDLLANYWTWDTSTKNRFLRELIEKAVYTKNAKNTWKNGDDISFTLDIYPKIQQK